MRVIALLLLFFPLYSYSANFPVTYDKPLTAEQQQHFEKNLLQIQAVFPLMIRQGLPENLSLLITDLNRGITAAAPGYCDNNRAAGFRYGRYYSLTRVLAIDYRIAACVQQALAATLVHELVHAWDDHVARGDRLSLQPALLQLGYWERGWFILKQGNTHPQRSPDLHAYHSPREFLASSVEHFLLDPDWACRQPALYQFFSDYFHHTPAGHPSSDCAAPVIVHYGEWPVIRSIDPARVYRIDYLLAAEGNNLISNFGHSMFRLVICAPARWSPFTEMRVEATPYGPACLDDEAFHLVVSFRANVDDVVLDYWKGLTGAYVSRPFILPYPQIVEEYTSDQLRDITLYPLALTETQKQFFIERALEVFWSYSGDYRFISNNCAVESLQLLQSSLPFHGLQSVSALTPRGVLEKLVQTGLVDPASPAITTVNSERATLEKLYRIAYPLNDFPVDSVDAYLSETKAAAREGWFPRGADRTVERIAALRRLEQQIRRQQQRELTLAARYYLYDSSGADVQSLVMPWQIHALRAEGYGVPFAGELSMDEAALQSQHRALKAGILDWIKLQRMDDWREYEAIGHNLDALDILALRKVD